MSGRLKIHLIRHPAPEVAPGVCYGQSDLAAPADAAAERLQPLLPARYRVVSSPLRRCLNLAQSLARSLAEPVATDPRLMEMHFGDWENRRWDDIPRAEIDAWATAPFAYAPPGGESAHAMAKRVIAFADAWQGSAATDDWVIVAHQGPLRILLAHWLDLPPASWLKLHFDFAASSCLELSEHGNRLLWLNR